MGTLIKEFLFLCIVFFTFLMTLTIMLNQHQQLKIQVAASERQLDIVSRQDRISRQYAWIKADISAIQKRIEWKEGRK